MRRCKKGREDGKKIRGRNVKRIGEFQDALCMRVVVLANTFYKLRSQFFLGGNGVENAYWFDGTDKQGRLVGWSAQAEFIPSSERVREKTHPPYLPVVLRFG